MQHTASGWTYDVIKAFEIFNKIFITAGSKPAKTAVCHGLTTAGLI
jgi:hypothetical protein